MSYLVRRLRQLLQHYNQLPESVQCDSLAMIEALKDKGESISLLEYKSTTLRLATVTVENLVSFTEKNDPEAQLGAANQLTSFIQNLLRLTAEFEALYKTAKNDVEIVEALKQTNAELLFVYEAPYSVTVEIKKVLSFTAKSTAGGADGFEEAAREVVGFLKQLTEID